MTTKSEREQEKKDREAEALAEDTATETTATTAAANREADAARASAPAQPTPPATPDAGTKAKGTKGSYQGHVFELLGINLDGTLHLKGRDANGQDVFVDKVRPEWFTQITEPPVPGPAAGSLPGVTPEFVKAQMPHPKGPNEPEVDEPAGAPVVETSATSTPASRAAAAAAAAAATPAADQATTAAPGNPAPAGISTSDLKK